MGRIGKPEHTPAPWRYIDEYSMVVSDVAQDINHDRFKGFNEKIRGGFLICESVPLTTNGELIAAAPEMLEALEIAQHWGYGQTPSIEEEEKVQNAIKKARGL